MAWILLIYRVIGCLTHIQAVLKFNLNALFFFSLGPIHMPTLPPNREAMPDADFAQWVDPEKLAQVICFLASDEATAIHGALLPVKGLV